MTQQLTNCSVVFGCDPELFFTRAGKVVGSEKVIPAEGLPFKGALRYDQGKGLCVQDGIQVEINPQAKACRANLGNEIGIAFRTLREHLKTLDGLTVSFNSVVEIDKDELASLSEKSRLLGCQPSMNMYDKAATVSVSSANYHTRSAGGHIHMGLSPHLMPHRERLVPILDILLGNTCVMIDRDPMAAERRKQYGRAGEYRLPKHGLEYRTLSNFWLKACPLMSLVMGLVRMSNSVLHTTLLPNYFKTVGEHYQTNNYPDWDAETALLKSVDLTLIRKAINGNDAELAKENFKGVRQFIIDHSSYHEVETGLNPSNLAAFDHFVKMIQEKGLDYWFPEDPMSHWCKIGANEDATTRTEVKGLTDADGQGAEEFFRKIGRGLSGASL